RVVFACWREPHHNPWMMVPLEATYAHLARLPEIGPEDPGPFSLARAERIERIMRAAGFDAIALEPVALALDVGVGRGLDAAVEGALSIGPVSRALEDQPGAMRMKVATSIRAALARFCEADRVPLRASFFIVSALNGEPRKGAPGEH